MPLRQESRKNISNYLKPGYMKVEYNYPAKIVESNGKACDMLLVLLYVLITGSKH